MCLLVLFQDMRLSHAFIPGTPIWAYSLHSFPRRHKCPQVTKAGVPTTKDLNLYFSWMLKGKSSQVIWVSWSFAYSSTETYKISVIYTHTPTYTHLCTHIFICVCMYTTLWYSSWIKPFLTEKSFCYNCLKLVTSKILGNWLYTLS